MKRMIVLLMSLCLLSGCTKSNIISGGEESEALPEPVNGIVWEQLWQDFDEVYTDLDTYPFAETVSGGVYPEEKMVKFYLLLNQTISNEEAAKYATEVIKGFNDLIAEQNNNYAYSTEDSYGGFVEQFGIYVMVAPDGSKIDTTTWILEDTIPQGEYREVNPDAGVRERPSQTEEETANQ